MSITTVNSAELEAMDVGKIYVVHDEKEQIDPAVFPKGLEVFERAEMQEVQERCMTAEAGLAKREEVLQSLASEVDAMVADAERGGGPQPHGETTVGWGSIRRIHQLLTDV